MPRDNPDIVEYIVATALDGAARWRWCREPLTSGSARAFILQHILRNRFYSAVMRPAWMSRCPDLAIVRKTIDQMHEELVYDSRIQAPHTKILWEFGRNAGLTDEQMNHAAPEPLVAASFNTLENLARTRHWLVGWLGSSISEFAGTRLPGHNFNPGNWRRALGLGEEQVFFLRYHQKADLDHAGEKVWDPIRMHVTSDDVAREIEDGLAIAIEALRCFFEGVALLGERLDKQASGDYSSAGAAAE